MPAFTISITAELDAPTLALLNGMAADISSIKATVAAMQTQETHMATTLDQVLADVTAETTAIGSVQALITGLQQQIAAAGLSAADQAKVDSIMAALQSNDAALAAALASNVPPAPAPAPGP